MSDTPAPSTPASVTSDQVKDWLGADRVAKLQGISNGRFDEHLQAACQASAEVGFAALLTIQACGGKVKQGEVARINGMPLESQPVPPALKPEKKQRPKATASVDA